MNSINYEKLIGDLEGLLIEVNERCEVLRRKDEAKAASLQDEIVRYVNFEIIRLKAEMEYSREPQPQIPPLLPFFPDMHFTEQVIPEHQQSPSPIESPKVQSDVEKNESSINTTQEHQGSQADPSPVNPIEEKQPPTKQPDVSAQETSFDENKPFLPIPSGIASQITITVEREDTKSGVKSDDEDFLSLDDKKGDGTNEEIVGNVDDDLSIKDDEERKGQSSSASKETKTVPDVKSDDDDDFLSLDDKKGGGTNEGIVDDDDDDFLSLEDKKDDGNANKDPVLVDFVADAYSELGVENKEVVVPIEDGKGGHNQLRIRLSDHTEEAVRDFLRKYGPTKQYVDSVKAKLVASEGSDRGITLPFEVNGKTVSLTTKYDTVEDDLKKLFGDNNIPDDIVSTVVELVDTQKEQAQKK